MCSPLVAFVALILLMPTTVFAQAGAGTGAWMGSSGPVPHSASRQNMEPEGRDTSTILEAERRLQAAGFSPGLIDGVLDGKTRDAIRGFQRSRGMDPTGGLDAPTRAALLGPSRVGE